MSKKTLIIAILIGLTACVYGRVVTFEFINFDDQDYVTENTTVQNGLTIHSVVWAFSLVDNDLTYWHPLTYISHMVDCELFGLNSGAHHFTNLLIHILNTCLLFITLVFLTGKHRESAFAAFLFALHPIAVDSVAWVAQRKTLLATFFWIASILTYSMYVRKGGWIRYGCVCLCVTAGLMCKPVLVTVPFVLLLFDFWPYNRIKHSASQVLSLFRIVAEKIPLLLLCVLWSVTPFLSHHVTAKEISFETVSLSLRLKNAIVSIVIYLKTLVLPANLTLLYPYPETVSTVAAVAAFGFLVIISGAFYRIRGKAPYALFGWLLFLIVIFPFLGIIQGATWPAYADRFAYAPFIGFYIIIAWAAGDSINRFSLKKSTVAFICFGCVTALSILTFIQVGYWKNSISVYEHALEITRQNYIAHNNLGTAYDSVGRTEDARHHYQLSLLAYPGYSKAHHNLGIHYLKCGDQNSAENHFLLSLTSNPDNSVVTYNLGNIYLERGETSKARTFFETSLALNPGFADAHNNLGLIFSEEGSKETALVHFRQALLSEPESVPSMINLGNVLFDLNRFEESLLCFLRASEIDSGNVANLNGLGVTLMALGRYHEAHGNFSEILKKEPDNKGALQNISIAEFQMNRTETVIEDTLQALRLSPDSPELMVRLALLYQMKGDAAHSESFFLNALNQSPSCADALSGLAYLYEKTSQFNKAILYYSRLAETTTSERPDIYYTIACMYGMMNNEELAMKWLRKAADEGFRNLPLLQADLRLNGIRSSDVFREYVGILTETI